MSRTGWQRINSRTDPAFGTLAHFEANKAKYIEAIANSYNYDKDLIDIALKPGSLTDIIVTFRVQDETAKTKLVNTMQDSSNTLATKLNRQLAAAGAQVNTAGGGITNGAITDVAGMHAY